MGGRGSKGHRSKPSLSRELSDQQQDPTLPPEATAAPDQPAEPVAPQPTEQPQPEPPTEQVAEPAPALTAEQQAHKRVERRIEDAYQQLTTGPRQWTTLLQLRAKLADTGLSKDRIDQVLKAMSRDGRLHLAPDSNRKTLTEEDHQAAIHIGGENVHLVAFEAPEPDQR